MRVKSPAFRPRKKCGEPRSHVRRYRRVEPKRAPLLSGYLVKPLLELDEVRETLVVVDLVLQTASILVDEGSWAAFLSVAVWANLFSFVSCREPPRCALISLHLQESNIYIS